MPCGPTPRPYRSTKANTGALLRWVLQQTLEHYWGGYCSKHWSVAEVGIVVNTGAVLQYFVWLAGTKRHSLYNWYCKVALVLIMKGRFCVSIVKTVKNKIFKSSLSALFLHWAGPHPLHHWSPVFQPQAAGKCHVCLQASPDRGKQAAHGTAGSLSSWIPLCLQGNAMSLCVPIPPCPQKQVILCEYLFVTSLSDNAAEPVYVNIMQTCPFKFYMHTSFSRNTSVPFLCEYFCMW